MDELERLKPEEMAKQKDLYFEESKKRFEHQVSAMLGLIPYEPGFIPCTGMELNIVLHHLRKGEIGKTKDPVVAEAARRLGYDVSICRSTWSIRFPSKVAPMDK